MKSNIKTNKVNINKATQNFVDANTFWKYIVHTDNDTYDYTMVINKLEAKSIGISVDQLAIRTVNELHSDVFSNVDGYIVNNNVSKLTEIDWEEYTKLTWDTLINININ
jgi:hypothetical protein